MRTQLLYTMLERSGGTHECLDTQSGGSVGCVDELGCPMDGKTALGEHALGAIEKAEALLGLELKWLNPCSRKDRSRRNGLTVDEDLSLTDEGKSKVGEGRQIARCTDRSL
jgi:hypothetical protein